MDSSDRTLQDLLNPKTLNTYYLYIPFPKSLSAFRVIDSLASHLEASEKDKFVFHAEPRVVRITGKESHLVGLQREIPSIKIQNQLLPLHSSNDPRRKRKKRFKLAIYGVEDSEVKKWESFLGVPLRRDTRNGVTLGNFTVERDNIIPSIQRAILEENVDRVCVIKPVNFCPKCLAFIWKKNGERMCRCEDIAPSVIKRKPGRPPGSKTKSKPSTDSNSSSPSTSTNVPNQPMVSTSSANSTAETKPSASDPLSTVSGTTSSTTRADDELISPSSPGPVISEETKNPLKPIELPGLFGLTSGGRLDRISKETRLKLLSSVPPPKPNPKPKRSSKRK